MSLTMYFMVGVLISILIGFIAILVLLHPLKLFLDQQCGSNEGVRFWSRYVAVLLVLAPVISYIFFGPLDRLDYPDLNLQFARQTLATSFGGLFFALAFIGIFLSKASKRKSEN